MPILTKAQLEALNQASFPDNSSEEITPEILRTYNTATIDTLVDSLDTGSFVTSAITGSSLITASFDNGTRNLTFTKGDTTQFSVNISDASGSIIPAGVVSGSSQVILQSTTGNLSGSRIDGDVQSSVSASYALTASFALNVPAINTGSFATTGSNIFIGNQTITGSLNITGSQTIVGEVTSSRLRVNSSTSLGGTLSVAFDTIMRGDLTIESTSPQIKLRDNGAGGFSSGYDLRVDTGSFEIYDDTHDRDVLSDFFNSSTSKHTTSLTSEVIVISGSDSVTLIGNVSASVISSSIINGLGDPTLFSASVDSRIDAFEAVSSSYARTDVNNNFGGNQTFNNIVVNGTASIAQLNYVSGSATIIGDAFIVLNTDTPTLRYAGIEVTDSGSGGTASFQWDGDVDQWLIVDEAGKSAYVLSGPTGSLGSEISLTNNRLTKAGLDTQILDSSISDDGTTVSVGANLSVTGSIQSNGTSVLLDGALSQLNSFTSSQEITNTALNSFTASQESKDSTLATYTGSIDTKFDTIGTQSGSWENVPLTSLNAFTSSQQILNAQFATTGSNTFNGNQIVNGLASQTFTAPDDNTQKDIITVTGVNTSGKPYNLVNFSFQDYGGGGANYDDSFAFECFDSFAYNYGSELTINGQRIDFGLIASGSGRVGRFSMRDQYNGTTFSNLYADEIQIGEFAAGTNNRIGIGHTALPILELKGQNVSVTGSLSVSGSINTSVIPLTITSNTASLNASTGNTFQLNLVSGSQTRLEISGTKSGQTINLLVSQSASGPGTLVFGDNIVEPSGSFYSASAVASAEDILTMATFINANRIYVANVKNFI